MLRQFFISFISKFLRHEYLIYFYTKWKGYMRNQKIVRFMNKNFTIVCIVQTQNTRSSFQWFTKSILTVKFELHEIMWIIEMAASDEIGELRQSTDVKNDFDQKSINNISSNSCDFFFIVASEYMLSIFHKVLFWTSNFFPFRFKLVSQCLNSYLLWLVNMYNVHTTFGKKWVAVGRLAAEAV